MNLPDIKKFFAKDTTKSYKSFVVMRPNHDWKIIITIFISSSIILIATSFFFWTRVKNEDIFNLGGNSAGNTSLINQELMDKTMNKFKDRANKINNFPKNPIFLTDPNK